MIKSRVVRHYFSHNCLVCGLTPDRTALMTRFSKFYGAVKDADVRPYECIVEAGEVIFVPSGWWHVVINVEESIAVTQNYVGESNLVKCLDFCTQKRDQVSGCGEAGADLAERFSAALERTYPGLEARVRAEAEAERLKKLGFWEKTVSRTEGSGEFSFGFG